MPVNCKKLRRSFEAAVKDREPDKFFEDIGAALEAKELLPEDFSIRELYEEFVPHGREVIQQFMDPRNRTEKSLVKLMESDAVKTSNFSNITGQIAYSKILEGYQAEDFVFSKMIPDVPTQFDGEKIPGMGQMGDKAEVVEETGDYPMVGINEDWVVTPSTLKRGLVVPVTKEAIFFDRTGLILKYCSEVGNWLGVNKEKRAIDCFIDENTTRHRYNRKGKGAVATYGDNSGSHDWDNLQAQNALVDWTDIDNAEQLLYSMLDPNTGEPIVIGGTMPKLVCTRALSTTAMRIRNATEITTIPGGYATSGTPMETRSPNPMANGFEVIYSRLLAARMATDTDWFYGFPERSFAYMQNWPMNVKEAPVNSEMEFQRDIVMRYRADERGQYATLEPRTIVKNTVS